MTAVDTSTAAERFFAALAERDYDALAASFTPDASLRAIVPPGLREADGPAEITALFRRWTGSLERFELRDAEAGDFADMLRLRWVVHGHDPDLDFSPSTFEQTAYAELDDTGRIVRMRLACSGDRPAS